MRYWSVAVALTARCGTLSMANQAGREQADRKPARPAPTAARSMGTVPTRNESLLAGMESVDRNGWQFAPHLLQRPRRRPWADHPISLGDRVRGSAGSGALGPAVRCASPRT